MFVTLCYITSKKDGMEHSRFAISMNFLWREQLAKVNVGSGLPVSNLVTRAWRISKERDGCRILTTMDNWQLWKSLKRIIPQLFVAIKSLESVEIGRIDTGRAVRRQRVRIFSDLLERNERTPFMKNLVTGDESWLLYKNAKKKMRISRSDTKRCNKSLFIIRRQCSAFGGIEVDNSLGDHLKRLLFLVEWQIPKRNGKKTI